MLKKRWALSVPVEPFPLSEHPKIAREMWDLGYTDAWSYEADGIDCFSPLAAIAMTTEMRVGTAIANVFSRGPAVLAQTASGLAQLAPERFELGIGTGSEITSGAWNSVNFERPLTRVREMVEFLRKAFSGEKVIYEGSTFRVNGFRLSRRPDPPPRIHIAALRPGMLALAGEVGDGAIINWLSAEDVKKSVAVVRKAAGEAGRDPDSIEIIARLMVCVDPPGEMADTGMRRSITGYVTVPVYKKFHQWLGRGEALEAVWHNWEEGDRRAATASLSPKTIGELMIHGSAQERREHVMRYLESGVDTAFLQMHSFETDTDKRGAYVMQSLREMAPSAY